MDIIGNSLIANFNDSTELYRRLGLKLLCEYEKKGVGYKFADWVHGFGVLPKDEHSDYEKK